MKRLVAILFGVLASLGSVWAQEADSLRTVAVEEIVVRGARSLRDIGVQKSIMSDAVLKESLSASMAEVLAQNSTIFIKSSGRATLSTASLRGTAPSHTAVTWNGVELASPMLGMVDFSLIPSYFVDGSEVYHGSTSVNVTGGGIGGAVALTTSNELPSGLNVQYIQSLASFSTHDEYLRIGYGNGRWGGSTRILNSASENDFPYINYDKVGHPREYNKSCGYHDKHLLQELYLNGRRGGRWSLKVWATDSSRGIPKLSVDYRDDDLTKAWQDEQSVRSVTSWRRSFGGLRVAVLGGYNIDLLHYIYQFSKGGGLMERAVDSRSLTHHTFTSADAEWSIGNNLMLAANLKGSVSIARSEDVAPLVPVGFEGHRKELSSFLSARWKPIESVGLAASVREEWRDGGWSPVIPALFVDVTLLEDWGLIVSSSVAKNYHHPTLSDLYFVPGGNPNLLPEEGVTFDLGVECGVERGALKAGGKVTLYGSNISNWILWTPTIKGFWTPENLSRVRSRGVESRANLSYRFSRRSSVEMNAIFAYTSSVNATENSASYGNQLPYIPLYSASMSLTARLGDWELKYGWQYYSERYTSYSGTSFGGGVVDGYQLSDVSLSRGFTVGGVRVKACVGVNNLFDVTYQSVLSRPMPPRNYSASVEISWGK
ncbi:MAG: TonB-dependent receptor plug domain-containing protein [Tidjanibacter sp.]|nr:TonB-dependent receptor plug domain-containing protein [Tidjanibacter sp.]